jgi:hypothetical protein
MPASSGRARAAFSGGSATVAAVVAVGLGLVTAAGSEAVRTVAGSDPGQQSASSAVPIDRQALVTRHHPVLRAFDAESPLSVGNGEFAFTVDVTGLQTFAEAFEQTTPLGTLSNWGWHTAPNPSGWSIDRFHHNEFESHGRQVGYADIPDNTRTPEIEWLRANPHRLHLGQIGLRLTKADGSAGRPTDLSGIEQTLDLWQGLVVSRFVFEGQPVEVRTVCHPSLDAIAVSITSSLVADGRLGIDVRFPYGTGQAITADWTRPEAHQTRLSQPRPGAAHFDRSLDADGYGVDARWAPVSATLTEEARHTFLLRAGPGSASLEFTAWFRKDAGTASGPASPAPAFAETTAAARDYWTRFWATGGAIDLSASRDSRWRELERRIVLSRYLTAIQCSGSLPPQETGLTYNSWEGKFHLEMHWWHAAQFALWDRVDLLDRSLGYYARILPKARATAARQGYTGARWPKMTDPAGNESPSSVGPFLVWQQPHPIYYAELVYRARGDRATLDRFAEVVRETAEFMASFAAWDEHQQRCVLGPPLQCAQERFPKDRTRDCAFELSYWRWGLEAAQAWKTRLGLARDQRWDRVLSRLAEPAAVDGKYLFANSVPDSYADPRWRTDHPSVLASLGVLPGARVDRETMRRTLKWVWANWAWPDTWGWDYPMVAMTAARLGETEMAIDALLLDTPKNHYRPNGHNHQRPGLTIYLPGNGGLLSAVAMMAAGWDGAPPRHAPGFPDNGQWTVRWEGLRRMP